MSPKLYLAIDNCFASKRWVQPIEWMQIARECDVYAIEASADNECDPLYSTPETLQDWLDAIRKGTEETGVRVANFYSGHGTYATLGLCHPDERVRDHIQHDWLEMMIRNAASLGAGLGFFTHAFSQVVLRDTTQYNAVKADLIRRLAEIARFAADEGMSSIGVEQMYSPHQIPWRIDGTLDLLAAVQQQAGVPFYLTLDVGHQVGQQYFQKPTREQVAAHLNGDAPDLWLGLPDDTNNVEQVMDYIEAHPQFFAQPQDGDLYAWTRTLGCYSPIIHLQQTDGSASAHRPFTPQYNETGIVKGDLMLKALAESYAQALPINTLPPTDEIYFTIEVFSGTAQRYPSIIDNLKATAAYWRQFIPEDGITLDEAVARL